MSQEREGRLFRRRGRQTGTLVDPCIGFWKDSSSSEINAPSSVPVAPDKSSGISDPITGTSSPKDDAGVTSIPSSKVPSKPKNKPSPQKPANSVQKTYLRRRRKRRIVLDSMSSEAQDADSHNSGSEETKEVRPRKRLRKRAKIDPEILAQLDASSPKDPACMQNPSSVLDLQPVYFGTPGRIITIKSDRESTTSQTVKINRPKCLAAFPKPFFPQNQPQTKSQKSENPKGTAYTCLPCPSAPPSQSASQSSQRPMKRVASIPVAMGDQPSKSPDTSGVLNLVPIFQIPSERRSKIGLTPSSSKLNLTVQQRNIEPRSRRRDTAINTASRKQPSSIVSAITGGPEDDEDNPFLDRNDYPPMPIYESDIELTFRPVGDQPPTEEIPSTTEIRFPATKETQSGGRSMPAQFRSLTDICSDLLSNADAISEACYPKSSFRAGPRLKNSKLSQYFSGTGLFQRTLERATDESPEMEDIPETVTPSDDKPEFRERSKPLIDYSSSNSEYQCTSSRGSLLANTIGKGLTSSSPIQEQAVSNPPSILARLQPTSDYVLLSNPCIVK